MQHHYATVRGEEQREGLARVIQLVAPQVASHRSPDASGGNGGGMASEGGGMERKKA
jgi:hypothetical protein